MGDNQKPVVFISYSHRDPEWLERLKVHLKPLFRDSSLSLWDDSNIPTGANWKSEIRDRLAAAKVAVLLISADYLASDFISASELPQLLEQARTRNCAIFPVIVKPSVVQRIPGLTDIEFANPPTKPLLAMGEAEQEATLAAIACAIYDAATIPNPGVCMTSSSIASQAQSAVSSAESADSKFLYAHFLNVWETQHLRKLAAGDPFPYTPRQSFERELRRLLEVGFIDREPGRGVRTAMRDGSSPNDLRTHFHVTDEGRKYIGVVTRLVDKTSLEERAMAQTKL